MTHINRQKFLTELSKFLTFLNEEEREKVLEKFESIFDRSANEDELIASIDSPLKMTVEMSRAYTKGGLEEVLGMCDDLVSGQWVPGDLTDTIREQVFNAIDEDTFSSIDIVTDKPEAPSAAVNPLEDDGLVAVFEQDMKEEEEEDGEETSEEYSLEPEEPAEEPDEKPEETEEAPEEPEATEEPEEPAEEEAPEQEEVSEDIVEEISEAVEEAVTEEAPVLLEDTEEPAEPEPADSELTEEVRRDAEIIREELEDLEPEEIQLKEEPQYKARWWALIPYAIIAIPLGLVGVIVCAAISIAILAVAAALVAACVLGASLALQNGMDVVADIILVAGAALVAAGLALLVIWLAVWFAVTTIGGIVGGLSRLGRKWCYKEVVSK